MQSVAEFMEQSTCFIEAQQRIITARRLGNIEHIDNDRPDIAIQLLLRAKGRHPGTTALRGAGKIIT